jgi:hypothetical protein
MQDQSRVYRARWWFLALIVLLQISILIVSPEERIIGAGIKPVYLHVSLTWTGMILLALTGFLGLILIVFPNTGFAKWHKILFLTGLGFYAVGFFVSMVASLVNWGGIPFQEPRIRGAINVLVAGTAAWILSELVTNIRIKGFASIFPLTFIFFTGRSSRMVLHPDNPVSSSPMGIKTTFLTMFGLALLLSAWAIWLQEKRIK